MQKSLATLAVSFLLITCGCGSGSQGPVVAPPADPVASYSASVKRMVQEIQSAQQASEGEDPQAVVPAVVSFVENLEGFEAAPVGDHKQTYADLLKAAKELRTLLEKSKWNAECNKKFAEMTALTEKLPGK